jgi:dTDP-4-dehydrorhamnose reductase
MKLELPGSSKILITGRQGQLGKAFCKQLAPEQALAVSKADFDLSKPQQCLEYLEKNRPAAILNAAAYTQVDLAEKESELAYQINSEAPAVLAQWCASNQVPFVHFSTDYVFSGEGQTPWVESDPISPQNVYGKSKAEGEQRILSAGGQYLIFRTSWVYDAQGKNFLNTMLKLGQERESLRIVSDQIGVPTFASDLAQGSLLALQNALQAPRFPSGIYHLCNEGETSWYQFAQTIFQFAKEKGISLKVEKVNPILSDEYPTPARRPKNSRLSTELFFRTFGVRLPNWQESLARCMEELN